MSQIEELVNAILVAADPSRGGLHQQALDYISTVQQNASTTWSIALSLFVDTDQDGKRRYPAQARFFALRVLDDFFDNRFEPLDQESFQTLQQAFMSYIQSEYVYGPAEADAAFLRNKFSHTLTLFFLCTYTTQWTTFFADLFTLIRPADSSSDSASSYNRHVSLLFFHLVLEISGEVADQIIKSARGFNQIRHARDGRVRDAVRERDAAQINQAVLTIVADAAERMASSRSADLVELVDWGIRTFGSYVGWIDINLTITPTTIPLLFNLLADPAAPIRLATALALMRVLAKGLKEPMDKIQLIKVLSLGQVIDSLEGKTRQEQIARGSDADEEEESYREALGKLLNQLGTELIKVVDECTTEDVRSEATKLLEQILPVTLRFMADEYDDTCSTIFPMLTLVLTSYKKTRKSATDPLDDAKRTFLVSLLSVIMGKMKWDGDEDPEDLDEEDKTAFNELRKELRIFMDSVLTIEPDLVTSAAHTLAINTLSIYQNGVSVPWNDAELAIYLVYIFGEINKSAVKGRAAFCVIPPTLSKEERKEIDCSSYPLTRHGEMLLALVQSGISAFPNRMVAMQFFETVARYSDFFKIRNECIVPTLEAIVDSRGLHNPDPTMRSRIFYLFYRFIKEGRNYIPLSLAATIVEGIRDLLVIQVELLELDDPEKQDLLTETMNSPGLFDSQLYLFETVGILSSLLFKSADQQSTLLLSVVKPLLDDLSVNLQMAKGTPAGTRMTPDLVFPIAKVHHISMALGNIAKGFPDYPSPVPAGYVLPPIDVFVQIAQAVMVCLESMNSFKGVRDAARFSFSRILSATGPNVTSFIPKLMTNLLSYPQPSELVDFMNLLGQLIHKLQGEMYQVLDELIGPLSTHITNVVAQPASGTDDQLTKADTKKAYLGVLNGVMAAKLQGIFTSERNNSTFEGLLETMQSLAEDLSDPAGERAAFTFLIRGVTAWGASTTPPPALNGTPQDPMPGFERFIYERLVPGAFRVLSSPQFNVKDGQMLTVLSEIAGFLHAVGKARGQEAYEFFLTSFLPAQNWPQEAAMDFTTKLRDLDNKDFRRYFSTFVKASRQ